MLLEWNSTHSCQPIQLSIKIMYTKIVNAMAKPKRWCSFKNHTLFLFYINRCGWIRWDCIFTDTTLCLSINSSKVKEVKLFFGKQCLSYNLFKYVTKTIVIGSEVRIYNLISQYSQKTVMMILVGKTEELDSQVFC